MENDTPNGWKTRSTRARNCGACSRRIEQTERRKRCTQCSKHVASCCIVEHDTTWCAKCDARQKRATEPRAVAARTVERAAGRVTLSHEEWLAKGRALFGDDHNEWRFVCPACKHVTRVRDWKDAGAPNAIAFSCVGRYIDGAKEAFTAGGNGPCTYAGGGLFRLNPVLVTFSDGTSQQSFDFAPAEGAKP